jgi:transcriptional regulator with XRE-family HTH domain
MNEIIITCCDNVKHQKLGFDLARRVFQNAAMGSKADTPYFDQGRRLRWLRQAERISTGSAFAAKVGWGQSGYSQFETGKRRVPMDKALQLSRSIPGFDPLWLWEGEKRGLGFDLRQRIEAEEAKETQEQLASGER